jgi:hypothetical protein
MSKKLGELVDRWVRGEDLHFNHAQQGIFDAAKAMLCVLLDENISLDDPAISDAIRSYLVDFMLMSPLPRGTGHWPKSDEAEARADDIKAEARRYQKQLRGDGVPADDAWQMTVREMKNRYSDLQVNPQEKPRGERKEPLQEWQTLRDLWSRN